MARLIEQMVRNSGPRLRPTIRTSDRPQGDEWVDVRARPVHAAAFQARLNHQLVGAFNATVAPNGGWSLTGSPSQVVRTPTPSVRASRCSDRWPEAWPRIERHLRDQLRHKRTQRQRARRTPQVSVSTTPAPAVPVHSPLTPMPRLRPRRSSPTIVNGKPTPNHPWKRHPLLPGGRHALAARPKS